MSIVGLLDLLEANHPSSCGDFDRSVDGFDRRREQLTRVCDGVTALRLRLGQP